MNDTPNFVDIDDSSIGDYDKDGSAATLIVAQDGEPKKATFSDIEEQADRKSTLYSEDLSTVVAQGVDSGFQFGTAQYGYRDIVGIATSYKGIDLEFSSTTNGYFYIEYIASISNLTVAKFVSSVRVVSGAIVYQTTKCVQLIETSLSSSYYMNIGDWSITSDVCSQSIKSSNDNLLVYARIYGSANVTSQTLSEVNFGTAYTHSDTVEYPRQVTTEGRHCVRVSSNLLYYTDGDVTVTYASTGTYTVTVNNGTVKSVLVSLESSSGMISFTRSIDIITVYTRDTSGILTDKNFDLDYKVI